MRLPAKIKGALEAAALDEGLSASVVALEWLKRGRLVWLREKAEEAMLDARRRGHHETPSGEELAAADEMLSALLESWSEGATA